MVNKARWIETAADLVRDKRLEGILEIFATKSDRTCMRVVFNQAQRRRVRAARALSSS